MIKIIIVVGLFGVFMDTARCSPLASPQSDKGRHGIYGYPYKNGGYGYPYKMTADDLMKMMDAPLKNMVHQEGKIHWANKRILVAI